MNVQQYSINTLPLEPTQQTDLVFMFSGEHRDEFAANYERARTAFPCATIVGCSTAGEIEDTKVTSNHCVITAVTFESTSTFSVCAEVTDIAHSKRAGAQLAQKLLAHRNTPLKHIFVLSDGLNVNGSELVTGTGWICSQLHIRYRWPSWRQWWLHFYPNHRKRRPQNRPSGCRRVLWRRYSCLSRLYGRLGPLWHRAANNTLTS